MVTPTFTNDNYDCLGVYEEFKIKVNPSSDIIQPEDIVLCNGEEISVIFETNNSDGNTEFSWTSDIDIGGGLSDNGSMLFTANNGNPGDGNSSVTATITVTAQYDNDGVICDGPTKTFLITVNGNVDAQPTFSDYNGSLISCFEADDAYIELNPFGGTPFESNDPYLFNWTGHVTFNRT